MTAAARPALRGLAPSEIIDGIMAAIAAGQSMRKSANGDYWDLYSPVAFDDGVAAGFVLAGPVSGPTQPPTFRALVQSDLPDGVVLALGVDGTVPGGSTVANTTTNTPFAQFYQIAANYVKTTSLIKIRAWGVYSTAIAAPTLTVQVKIGSVVICTMAPVLTTGRANNGWKLECDAFVTAVGGAGSVEAQGIAFFMNVAAGLKGSDVIHGVNTAAVGSVPFNAAQNVAISVQWSAASVSNTITLRGFSVEISK